jgi:hypothetical protein
MVGQWRLGRAAAFTKAQSMVGEDDWVENLQLSGRRR